MGDILNPTSPTKIDAVISDEAIELLLAAALTSSDVQAACLAAIRSIMGGGASGYLRQVTKTLSTISATASENGLFTITGLVDILSITLFISTGMGTARTLRLGIYDATLTTEYFLCAASGSTAFIAGTLLGITGTVTDAMVGADGIPAIESQAKGVTHRPTTTATVRLTAAGASTGVVVAEALWIPKTIGATLVAA